MGWIRETSPGHEGFAVALVPRDGCDVASKLYRELDYPTDDVARTDIAAVKAGCECGWRSPNLPFLRDAAEWYPFCVTLSEHDEERLRRQWVDHVLVLGRSAGTEAAR
ncbi:MAG TPA: hypothetical protein VJA26_02750 [Gammaproteobacteria bacterium]|nr:hypothetical protein [Gammaproteobacteria bacterium]